MVVSASLPTVGVTIHDATTRRVYREFWWSGDLQVSNSPRKTVRYIHPQAGRTFVVAVYLGQNFRFPVVDRPCLIVSVSADGIPQDKLVIERRGPFMSIGPWIPTGDPRARYCFRAVQPGKSPVSFRYTRARRTNQATVEAVDERAQTVDKAQFQNLGTIEVGVAFGKIVRVEPNKQQHVNGDNNGPQYVSETEMKAGLYVSHSIGYPSRKRVFMNWLIQCRYTRGTGPIFSQPNGPNAINLGFRPLTRPVPLGPVPFHTYEFKCRSWSECTLTTFRNHS